MGMPPKSNSKWTTKMCYRLTKKDVNVIIDVVQFSIKTLV